MSENNGKSARKGLREVVKEYLELVGKTELDLHSASDIPTAQLRELLQDGIERNFSRQDISSLAFGIVFLYDQCGKSIQVLEEVLSKLLEAAGYGPMIINGQDWVFHRLALSSLHKQHKRFRVGYASWPPYIQATPRGVEGEFAEWTRRITTLAGLEVEFVPLEWRDIVSCLNKREVDLIAPIMKVPARTFELRFSSSLDVEIGVHGLVCRPEKSISRWESAEKYALNFVEGEVGAIVGQIVFPKLNAFVDDQKPHLTIESAVDFIRANPRNTEKDATRCLVVDEVTAEMYCSRFSDMSIIRGADVKFKMAFAADPREKRLIELVDQCIATLKEIARSKSRAAGQ